MLQIANATQTMSSREIAELVESRHDVVKKSIERLVERGTIARPPMVDGIKSANGTIEKYYLIGKRDSYIIVAQLSPEFTARLVDRWQELEATQQFKIPTTLSGALRLAAAQAETIEAQTLQLEAQKPQIEALHRISNTEHLNNMRDAAKVLRIKPSTMSGWLTSLGWATMGNGKHWFAMQRAIDGGWACMRENEIERDDGSVKIRPQILITQKGMVKLAEILANNPAANIL